MIARWVMGFFMSAAAIAQPGGRPMFEVASVKLSESAGPARLTSNPGMWSLRELPSLRHFRLRVQGVRVSGDRSGLDQIGAGRYRSEATAWIQAGAIFSTLRTTMYLHG